MRHLLALLLLAAPSLAFAQAKDATQSYDRATPGSSNLRNFTLRNTAANTITAARVRLSDDSTRDLTETGPITKSHNQTFAAPGKACLADIHVQFEGGTKARQVHPSRCLHGRQRDAPRQLVVRAARNWRGASPR